MHTMCLLDMIMNNRYEEPYNKFAPEGDMPVLSATVVKSRLSMNFWRNSKNIYGALRNNNSMLYQFVNNESKNEKKKDNNSISNNEQLYIKQQMNDNSLVIMKKTIDELIREHKIKDKKIQSNKYEIYALMKKQNDLNKAIEELISK